MPCERPSVLVVDDDAELRNVISELLRNEGYDVHTANDGREALDRLKMIGDASAVVLDMTMPVMCGWDVLAALTERGATLPVLAVSAAAVGAHVLRSGATSFLRKPMHLDELVQEVDRLAAQAA